MRGKDVKGLIEELRNLQSEIRGTVEDSVIFQFNEVILELEILAEKSDSSSSGHRARELFAMCLDAAGIGMGLYQIFTQSCR